MFKTILKTDKIFKGEDNLYHYFYKIINLKNNKFYFGIHSSKNFQDNYLGSGVAIKQAIKKYGKENFEKEILLFFKTRDELSIYEEKIINEQLINNPNCYNMTIGGVGNKKDYVYAYDNDENIYYVKRDDLRFSTGELKYKLLVVDNVGNKIWVYNDDPKYISGEYKSILTDKVSVVDKNGNNLSVSKNDSRLKTGELIPNTKGKITVKDKNGNIFQISKDDPKFLAGELHQVVYGTIPVYMEDGKIKRVEKSKADKYTCMFKNKVVVVDKNGNKFAVPKDDSRYLSGELKGHSIGTVPVRDKEGKQFAVSVNDPRYLSGELVSVTTGKIVVVDKKGNRFQTSTDNPLYKSGELVPYNKNMVYVKDKQGNKLFKDRKDLNTNEYTNYFKKIREVIDSDGRIFLYDINDLNFEKTGYKEFRHVRDYSKIVISVQDENNNEFKCYNDNPNLLNKKWFPKLSYKFNGKRVYEYANNGYFKSKPINNSYNKKRHVELYL